MLLSNTLPTFSLIVRHWQEALLLMFSSGTLSTVAVRWLFKQPLIINGPLLHALLCFWGRESRLHCVARCNRKNVFDTAYISLLAYVSTRGQASSLTAFTLRWMCLHICFLWRLNGIWQARRTCGGLISPTVPRKDWDWCRICIHLKQDEARLCSWLEIPRLLATRRSTA